MADFEYVTWNGDTPLSSTNLGKMSDNDQHLKDLVTAGPTGVIGYTQRAEPARLAGEIVGVNWLALSVSNNLDTTVTIDEDRFVKVSCWFQSIKGGVQGIYDCRTRVRLDGERTFGWTKQIAWANAENAFCPISRVGRLTAGEHEFTVELLVMPSAKSYGGTTWQAHATAPMYLMVEDLGEAIG